jgi:phage terminase large subunit-like protein
MKRLFLSAISFSCLVGASACGGDAPRSRYPALPPNCPVTLYHGAPQGRTVNIGPVNAACDQDVADADCLRTLEDEVCKLGGDVVWGVDETPRLDFGKKKYSGRAAHTRASNPASAASSAAAPDAGP